MATLSMLANFVLLYTVAVQAQIPLDFFVSNYARTVFDLRAQQTCNEPCQEISPIHCQDDVPTYTIFSPSSGKHTIIFVLNNYRNTFTIVIYSSPGPVSCFNIDNTVSFFQFQLLLHQTFVR